MLQGSATAPGFRQQARTSAPTRSGCLPASSRHPHASLPRAANAREAGGFRDQSRSASRRRLPPASTATIPVGRRGTLPSVPRSGSRGILRGASIKEFVYFRPVHQPRRRPGSTRRNMKRTSVPGTLPFAVIASTMLLGGNRVAAKSQPEKSERNSARRSSNRMKWSPHRQQNPVRQCLLSGTTEALEILLPQGVPVYRTVGRRRVSVTTDTAAVYSKLTADGRVHIEGCTAGGFSIEVSNALRNANCSSKTTVRFLMRSPTAIQPRRWTSESRCKSSRGSDRIERSLAGRRKAHSTTVTTTVKVAAKAEGTAIQWDRYRLESALRAGPDGPARLP